MASRLDQMTYWMIREAEPVNADRLSLLMWLADLRHYRRHGEMLSGGRHYLRTADGPEPYAYFEVLERLQRTEAARMRRVNEDGRFKVELTSRPVAGGVPFTLPERATLKSVAQRHGKVPLDELRRRVVTALGALWEEIPEGGVLSIRAASVTPAEVTAEHRAWARKALAEGMEPGV